MMIVRRKIGEKIEIPDKDLTISVIKVTSDSVLLAISSRSDEDVRREGDGRNANGSREEEASEEECIS